MKKASADFTVTKAFWEKTAPGIEAWGWSNDASTMKVENDPSCSHATP